MSTDNNHQRARRFLRHFGVTGFVVLICYASSLILGAARDRARLIPHVFCMGLGFCGGTSYEIRGTGEPVDEVERLVSERVDDWVTRASGAIAPSGEMIHRQSVCLSITAPRLSRRVLGRLHEFPRNDRYSLHLNLDIPEFSRDGFAALGTLANINCLALGPRIRGISPKREFLHGQVTDADLAEVAKLQALRSLCFTHVKLPDAALLSIRDLPRLEVLSLDDVQISPEGLQHVGRLTCLTSLKLQFMPVTDAHLSALDRLTSLEQLGLNDTQITDAGLHHLAGLTNLREVSLINTRVSEIGVAKLRLALAEARITR